MMIIFVRTGYWYRWIQILYFLLLNIWPIFHCITIHNLFQSRKIQKISDDRHFVNFTIYTNVKPFPTILQLIEVWLINLWLNYIWGLNPNLVAKRWLVFPETNTIHNNSDSFFIRANFDLKNNLSITKQYNQNKKNKQEKINKHDERNNYQLRFGLKKKNIEFPKTISNTKWHY